MCQVPWVMPLTDRLLTPFRLTGWPPQPPATVARTGIDMTRESGLSFDSQRIRRLPPSVALDFQVGEEVEVCLDRQADDRRWAYSSDTCILLQ